MRTREILIIGLFIIAVCVVSLISFSNNIDGVLPASSLQVNGTTVFESMKEGLDGNGNVSSGNITITPTPPPPNVTFNFPITINNNVDFITAVVYILAQSPNATNDKLSVYNLQSLVSPFKTQNAATLLGEISNPNNLTDSRLFLEYMNWFASHCPLDSNTCTGLC
jgi:hypothetical protein